LTGSIKAVRGMHDTLPGASASWQGLEQAVSEILASYGYREMRMPVVEKTELFERSIGETTDIVTKEMYTFTDRSGDRLTLRPEGTAGCVRAVLEHGLLQNSPLRLWYMGPMFRHERPQKGRLRQFHQIGIEVFGLAGPDIDAEIIIMCARMWRLLGVGELVLELNSLGDAGTRNRYRGILKEYFQDLHGSLDEDSLTRLEKNPLRILDSKNPDMQELIRQAPSIIDALDTASADHFAELRGLLDAAGVSYRLNKRLVRGLDYYNRTVFEWTTDRLGAQGTVCGGGRYDGMVEQFGGPATPAIGFGMGLERLLSLAGADANDTPHIYLIVASSGAMAAALRLAEQVRDEFPGIRLLLNCGGGSFKSQFKKADKSGAWLALVLGDEEMRGQHVGVKPLRRQAPQFNVAWSALAGAIREQLDQ
jgi:histidyl-tRNA synthetase